MTTNQLFDLSGRVAVVTGGSGVLGGAMAKGLLQAGAQVCILGRDLEKARRVAHTLSPDEDKVLAVAANVSSRQTLEAAAENVLARWGRIDILLNAAGGNRPDANATPSMMFFDLSAEALRGTLDLNLMGTVLPCQVFGKVMSAVGEGCIINISSMAAQRPLTRVIAYAAAKAGIDNFTRWLAVYMAREFSPRIRVNAIAPGFFLGEQNRAMLVDPASGELTARGQTIIDHTPMRRFGEPEDLVTTALWLAAPASAFITGIVVPVDGGFSAFGGV